MQQIDNSELKEFLGKIAETIKETIETKPIIIHEPIEVEVVVVKIKTGSGGIAIKVVEAGGKYQAHEVSRIKMKLEPNYDVIKPMGDKSEPPRIIPKKENYF